jgi:hypothetical protein
MNATPPPGRGPDDAAINPAMTSRADDSHGTRFAGTDPMASVSVKDPDEGRSWPAIWAVVAIACVAVAAYYLFL